MEINQIMEQRSKINESIKDIRNFKKGQKKLYAKFYEEQRKLKEIEESFALRPLEEWIKNMFIIDTTDIFYKKE